MGKKSKKIKRMGLGHMKWPISHPTAHPATEHCVSNVGTRILGPLMSVPPGRLFKIKESQCHPVKIN